MERKETFRFKQFGIDDRRCGMKVGTDGVLVGAWVSCGQQISAVDVGCGCGIISLMLAQRGASRITAVEVDESAAEDALSNFEASPWIERFDLRKADFRDVRLARNVDLIVSNPPFFATGEHSPEAERSLARHEGELNYGSLIDFAKDHLNDEGRLAFVYPCGYDDEIIYKAEMSRLKLRRMCRVRQRYDRPWVRTLYEFCRRDGAIEIESLTISKRGGGYTDNYIELTKDFYL